MRHPPPGPHAIAEQLEHEALEKKPVRHAAVRSISVIELIERDGVEDDEGRIELALRALHHRLLVVEEGSPAEDQRLVARDAIAEIAVLPVPGPDEHLLGPAALAQGLRPERHAAPV